MVDLERLEVPARGTLTLAPGGRHLMLHHLLAPLDPGEVITVTIVFERPAPMVVEAPVRSFNEPADVRRRGLRLAPPVAHAAARPDGFGSILI